MTKEQFLEKYENKAVWCKTEELANEFLELADGFGFKWWFEDENAKSRNEYNFYRQGTAYYLDSYFGIQTTSRSIAEKQIGKSRVIEFQSLKKTIYQKVLDILGLKVGDEFKLKKYGSVYKVDSENIFDITYDIKTITYSVLGDLIYGEPFEIITKSKLTESERVILENISKEYKVIKRNSHGLLFLYQIRDGEKWALTLRSLPYNHLFDSIKPDEEYEIKELLGE